VNETAACYEWREGELRLRARVVPRSARAGLGGIDNGRLRVHLHAPPREGRANAELIGLLAKACSVPRSAVRIVAGERGRDKTLLIAGLHELPAVLRE